MAYIHSLIVGYNKGATFKSMDASLNGVSVNLYCIKIDTGTNFASIMSEAQYAGYFHTFRLGEDIRPPNGRTTKYIGRRTNPVGTV